MKILHCCLAAFYNDNYGYQENIMPRMHKLQGHEVMILASTEVFIDRMHLGYIEPKKYINEDNIVVHRIPYVSWLPHKLAIKIRLYKGVYEELCQFRPDFIFLHDIQFLSINDIVRYMKENPQVQLSADGHSDFGNSARNFISYYILHRIIYKHCAKLITPYAKMFYGTLPARVDFFQKVYNIPKSKTELLVMGADDKYVFKAKKTNQRDIIRKRYSINQNDFLIVSGGKFDAGKRVILSVMQSVHDIAHSTNIKMLIFGSLMKDDEFIEHFDTLCDGRIVQYVGWIPSNESYNYFEAADLVIFPGTHSVLWEQAVGQGIPCIFKRIAGQTHIDLQGNCELLDNTSLNEIKEKIWSCINNYKQMYLCAQNAMKAFSYDQIARRAIQ